MKTGYVETIQPDVIIAGIPCYTRGALAKSLGKSEQTLAGWRVRGFGPALIMVGRRVLYPENELIAWLKNQTINPADKKKIVI